MPGYLTALACVLSLMVGTAKAQPKTELKSSKEPPPTARSSNSKRVDGHLVRVNTIVSPSEHIGVFRPPMRCDEDGNLYLLTEDGPVAAIHKLNAKGERVGLFDPSADADLKVDVADYFALAGDGSEVYQLVFPHEIDRYVFIFSSDGTFKSAVKLQPGFPFTPAKLAVFAGGQYLISGQEYDADNSAAMWPFTGIFAPDGRLLKELELEDDKTLHDMAASGDSRVASPVSPQINRAMSSGQVQVGADGNAYLMRWTNPTIFYVISVGGEVLRRFTINPGDAGFSPFAMQIYKNRIAVLFGSQTGSMIMKIADLEGNEIATYDLPPFDEKHKGAELSVGLACYLENPTRFVFVGTSDDRRLQLWLAEPR